MKILEVKNMTKAYDSSHGIFSFDFDVNSGDIVLLLGPNGAGKTTAFNSILGLTKSKYDSIKLFGENINEDNKHMIGAMVSKPCFYEDMTAVKYLDLFSRIYKLSDQRKFEVLDQVGLKEAENKKIKTFSTGMKQRLDIARSIIHQPKLLLLDEPFSGMDIEAKADFKRVLKSMTQTGVVISSHMVGDLESIANRLVIVSHGKILFNGSMSEVTKSGLDLEAFYLSRINSLKEAI